MTDMRPIECDYCFNKHTSYTDSDGKALCSKCWGKGFGNFKDEFPSKQELDFFISGVALEEEVKIELNRKILVHALARWGHAAQKQLLIEEMGELTVAVLHEARGKTVEADVVNELADVYIMLNQMFLIYGEGAVMRKVEEKMNRLEGRIKCS